MKNCIGICGNYSGNGGNAYNGQTVKTTILTEALAERFPEDRIIKADTSFIRRNPFRVFTGVLKLLVKCENIVILPAQLAVRVILPLMVMLNVLFKRNIHYFVVGGWITETMDQHPRLIKHMRKLRGIYVELHSMEENLKKRGLANVVYVPKFRKLNLIDKGELCYDAAEPHRLCIFSRVKREKGIEEAIQAVDEANKSMGRKAFTLDIYGQIDNEYAERFQKVCECLPDSVQYKGIVDFKASTAVLKNYFAMLFPTYYCGEGYANTIVDAFAAGLPVIATDWKYNPEVLENEGITYSWEHPEQLTEILLRVAEQPDMILNLKERALKRAEAYNPQKAIEPMVGRFER